MKKTLIALSLLSIVSIAQASYILKIPLEQSQGGSLPNGSIIMNENPIIVPTPSENWSSTTPLYSNWVNQGAIYDCTNWTPSPNTQTINSQFDQTATDCKQEQIHTRQDREIENRTLVIRNVGDSIAESQVLSATQTRKAIGTKETWVATTAIESDWVNQGTVYDCTTMTPAANTVLRDEPFIQSASNCKQNQTRTKQNREQETTTLAYRNMGEPVMTTQTITSNTSSSINAIGTATCEYRETTSERKQTMFITSTDNNGILVYLNGVVIGSVNGSSTASIVVNGKTYKRGTNMKNYPSKSLYQYQLCK